MNWAEFAALEQVFKNKLFSNLKFTRGENRQFYAVLSGSTVRF